MKFELNYTVVKFNCFKNTNIEEYILDKQATGAVLQMFQELKPVMDIYVRLIPFENNISTATALKMVRNHIEEKLGYESIKGKLRIRWSEGLIRISCLNVETFLRVTKLVKESV
jgi:hypothetical protein